MIRALSLHHATEGPERAPVTHTLVITVISGGREVGRRERERERERGGEERLGRIDGGREVGRRERGREVERGGG